MGWKVWHGAVWMGWLIQKRDLLEGSLCYQLQPGAESPVCPSDINQHVLFPTAQPDKASLDHLMSGGALSALSVCSSICWSPPSGKGERLGSIAAGKYFEVLVRCLCQCSFWHCMDPFIVDLLSVILKMGLGVSKSLLSRTVEMGPAFILLAQKGAVYTHLHKHRCFKHIFTCSSLTKS